MGFLFFILYFFDLLLIPYIFVTINLIIKNIVVMGKKNYSKRTTKWYVINIKSRGIQKPQTYIDAFDKLKASDPLVKLRGNRYISIKSMYKAELLENDGYVRSILVTLSAYDLIDPDGFYNRRSKENVSLFLDPDIAANASEVEIIFVPRVHRLAMRTNSKISLKNVHKYFLEALDKAIGEDAFDVTIVKDRNFIEQILSSSAIYSIEAELSYSNRDPSDGFQSVFDKKIREMNPTRLSMNIRGTQDVPLEATKDGLIEAIANLSESNGYIKAKVRDGEEVKDINTEDYPLNMRLDSNPAEDLYTSAYNELINRFDNNRPIDNEQG